MDRVEKDATPAEEWLQSLNATCNRLSTQHLNILKAAASVSTSSEQDRSGGRSQTSRAGGGHMMSSQDPPPPPLAADVGLSMLQCQLAAENIGVASAQIVSLIRTLRLSLLLMDEDTMNAEEQMEVERTQALTQSALQKAAELEQQYREIQNKDL